MRNRVQQLDGFAGWKTLRKAAEDCGLTYDAARMRVTRHRLPVAMLGQQILVRPDDLAQATHTPRTKKRR